MNIVRFPYDLHAIRYRKDVGGLGDEAHWISELDRSCRFCDSVHEGVDESEGTFRSLNNVIDDYDVWVWELNGVCPKIHPPSDLALMIEHKNDD